MSPAAFVFVFFCAVVATATILSQLALWQRKEYRFDRWRAFWSGEAPVGLWWIIIIVAILSNAGWLVYITGHYAFAELAASAGVVILALHHTFRIYTRGLFRPRFTPKALLIIACSAAIFVLWLLTADLGRFPLLQASTAAVLTPVVVAASVGVSNAIAAVRKRQIIRHAAVLRSEQSKLTVIGITGSAGKTTTKEFTRQLLAASGQSVAATAKHRNSELPVAQDILQQLPQQPDYYIAEMGAYRSGEIAALARLAQPRIGVITGIANQHLALFGSRQQLLAAKWELIKSLPKDGIAILNKDDDMLREKAKSWAGHIVWFGAAADADVHATNIHPAAESLTADITIGDVTHTVTLPLLGSVLLPNVLAALAVTHALNIPAAAALKTLSSLKSPPRTMELIKRSDRIIIDDSYSANETGVLAALEYLKTFGDTPKLVVLQPLIELGTEADTVYDRIGQALTASNAQVFVAGEEIPALRHAAGNTAAVRFVPSPQELANTLRTETAPVVLIEGRVADIVRAAVLRA